MKKRQRILSSILKDRTLGVFEKSVYKAVLTIPAGSVRSYKWVAMKAGYPRSSRAVGNALNKNPYIGIVPCHRVVRSDGFVGGFAGGLAAKVRLLKREGIDVRGMRLL